MTDEAKETWRATVATELLESGEVHADALHEGAEDDADLEEAIAACEQLVKEGLAVEERAGLYRPVPGREDDLQALTEA